MNKRNVGMDVIRCVALFSVISIHFFLNNGFYQEPVLHKRMYVMTLMRCLFRVCVPLFMVLSGYLMKNKKVEKSYYKRGLKIFWIYILASLACVFYNCVFLQADLSAGDILKGMLSFKNAPYSWYIEMYAGLFLMIPFLNLVYNNLPSKKWKQVLLLTGIIMTALPGVINVYNFDIAGWWSNPAMSNEYQQIIPDWWVTLYPITYYFIGCYLNEYGLKIKAYKDIILIIAVTLVFGTYAYWRSYGSNYIWGAWEEWPSIFNLSLTVLVFAFFANLDYSRMPEWIRKMISYVSKVSLGAYLVSWIFDQAFYPILIEKVPIMTERLEYYIIIVPLVFVCSVLLSAVLECIYKIGSRCFVMMKNSKR